MTSLSFNSECETGICSMDRFGIPLRIFGIRDPYHLPRWDMFFIPLLNPFSGSILFQILKILMRKSTVHHL